MMDRTFVRVRTSPPSPIKNTEALQIRAYYRKVTMCVSQETDHVDASHFESYVSLGLDPGVLVARSRCTVFPEWFSLHAFRLA